MIDYKKIDEEYDKIHKRLDEIEEKFEATPIQHAVLKPTEVGAGLPLHIRCFLIYRMLQLPNLKVETLYNANEHLVHIAYCDPYELPTIPRRMSISFDEMSLLWKTSGETNPIESSRRIQEFLPVLVEKYLRSQSYLT